MVHSNLRRNEVMSSAPMIFQEFMRSGNSRLGPQLEWKYRSPRVSRDKYPALILHSFLLLPAHDVGFVGSYYVGSH